MVQIRQQLSLELMREADVNTVQEIERQIFATPWPRNAYYRELASRASAHYVVLRTEGPVERPLGFRVPDFDPSIIGYGGMWRMYDEAHVTTIGVRHDLQHRGYGRIVEDVRGLRVQGHRSSQGLLHGQRRGRDRDVVGLDPFPALPQGL